MKCQHRRQLDEDGFQEEEDCDKEATHVSCVPFVNTPTCEEHKCRCAKPIDFLGPA